MENDIQSANAKSAAAGLKVNQAQIGSELYNKQLRDSELISPISGFVVDILVKSGEITNAGHPVIVVTSKEQVVNIGISVEDYEKVNVGMSVTMKSVEETFTGTVSSVAQYPEASSRTYNVEIVSNEMNLASGNIVDIKIPIETKDAVLTPIRSVISTDGENVFVKNIPENVIFVSNGVKDLKENMNVVISE